MKIKNLDYLHNGPLGRVFANGLEDFGIVAIKKWVFRLPSTTVANVTFTSCSNMGACWFFFMLEAPLVERYKIRLKFMTVNIISTIQTIWDGFDILKENIKK